MFLDTQATVAHWATHFKWLAWIELTNLYALWDKVESVVKGTQTKSVQLSWYDTLILVLLG